MLDLVRERFPALRLCAQSAQTYGAAMTQEAAQKVASSTGNVGAALGGGLVFNGLLCMAIGLALALSDSDGIPWGVGCAAFGAISMVAGLVARTRARAKGEHAAWLRMHGAPLTARISSVQPTGIAINDVPQYRFALQVAGPQGPYAASIERTVPEHQVAMLMGQEVRIRANPNKLEEVIFEE